MGCFLAAGYTETEARRFAAKVEPAPAGDCWLWTACTNSKGYGCLGLRKKAWLAHRLAYTVFVGPIPEGFDVDHVRDRGCTSTLCVNPAHLEAVPPAENMRRRHGVAEGARAEAVRLYAEVGMAAAATTTTGVSRWTVRRWATDEAALASLSLAELWALRRPA